MKFIYSLVSVFVFSQLASAQSPACTAQEVLTTCLSTEDTYLKTCIDQDYACLCKWHTAKLSCYDSCPQDSGKPFQQGSKDTFCSIAKTYNTTSSSSSVVPTVSMTTQVPSNSVSSHLLPSHSATTNSTTTSMSTSNEVGQSILMIIAGVTTWFLT